MLILLLNVVYRTCLVKIVLIKIISKPTSTDYIDTYYYNVIKKQKVIKKNVKFHSYLFIKRGQSRLAFYSKDKEKLVARAVGRRICKSCGATYHIEFNPSKEEGVCDICKGDLYQRADDNEETVSKRIQVYLDETKPLADYYSKVGIIADIDGQQSIDKVFNDIVSALESK